jgi:hypothetical protein
VKTKVITVSTDRRIDVGIGITLVTVPLAIASNVATLKQDDAEGKEAVPTTASASSPRD